MHLRKANIGQSLVIVLFSVMVLEIAAINHIDHLNIDLVSTEIPFDAEEEEEKSEKENEWDDKLISTRRSAQSSEVRELHRYSYDKNDPNSLSDTLTQPPEPLS